MNFKINTVLNSAFGSTFYVKIRTMQRTPYASKLAREGGNRRYNDYASAHTIT
ncbi:hypothetical protein [Marivirga sericea]|uniref:hypothetical protein n=1 Tax=Marivirga sericea TaxID=1028 RepID=UPI0015945B5E|nr:hypothetical protein [Marivirga sericea]